MTLGMTYEQYWDGDPEMFLAYANFYKRDSRSKFAEQDSLAWMVGSYVDMALGHVLSHTLGTKGSAKVYYPTQPQFITEIDENAKAKKQERELAKLEANFLAAVHNMGKTIEEAAQ